ncbi:MAG: MFS transporter [Alphaproteobacteria bacterium]|nr:MFS transporter [Alphaproteobacteria bacterium]
MIAIEQIRRKWWVLGAMGAALGMFLLDETVVGVALPTIQQDLDLSTVGSHWVVNIYLLVLTCLAAACGRLCDVFGFKRLFLTGIVLFGLASIGCGLATNLTELLAARALQGFGAAIIFPASMAMIAIIFPEEERGRALGIYGAVGTVFLASGPFVGGLLTDTLSWRWIFWINPVVVIAAVAVIWTMWSDPPPNPNRERFDFAGLVTLISGIGLVIFATMQGPEWGWSQPLIWVLLLAGLLFLTLFIRLELPAGNPLIEIDLLRTPAFAVCSLMVFTGQFTKIAVLVIYSIFLQKEMDMSPLMAGVALLAGVVPAPLSAIIGGNMTDRLGSRRPALLGLGGTFIAFVWLTLALDAKSYWLMFAPLVLWGIVTSMVFLPGLRGAANSVPLENQGQVGGIMLTAQLAGGTIGMTVCGTLLAATGSYQLPLLATAILAGTVFVLTWRTIKDDPSSQASTA